MTPRDRFTIEQIGSRFWIRDNAVSLNPLSSPRKTRDEAETRRAEIIAQWETKDNPPKRRRKK